MKGNEIVVSSEPLGKFQEGIIGDTSAPGTHMMIKAATEPVDGRHTWVAAAPAADGGIKGPIVILMADYTRGKIATDAYTSGDRGYLFTPAAGDECNVLFKNLSGTADKFAIGDEMMVDHLTGKAIAATGTIAQTPWTVLETVAAITADTLVWCKRN